MPCLDHPLGVGAIPDSLPDGRDTARHGGMRHVDLGPDMVEQLFPCDHTVRMLHEVHENLVDLGFELHGHAGAAELPALSVKDTGHKSVLHAPVLLCSRGFQHWNPPQLAW